MKKKSSEAQAKLLFDTSSLITAAQFGVRGQLVIEFITFFPFIHRYAYYRVDISASSALSAVNPINEPRRSLRSLRCNFSLRGIKRWQAQRLY